MEEGEEQMKIEGWGGKIAKFRGGPLKILMKRPVARERRDVWLLGKFWHKIPTGLSRHAVRGWRCEP